MKDLPSLVQHANDLDEVEVIVSAAGRISDHTRRELVSAVVKSNIPVARHQAACKIVMGSLSSVLDPTRCIDWWEAVSCSSHAVRAAIECKLPFKQDVIQEVARVEIIDQLLSAGNHEVAWCIWSEAADDNAKSEMVEDMIRVACGKDTPSSDIWIADICRVISKMPLPSKMEHAAGLFLGKYLNDTRLPGMTLALARCFPEGMSREDAARFMGELRERMGGSVPEVDDLATHHLEPLRAVFNHQQLEASTPVTGSPSPPRRI